MLHVFDRWQNWRRKLWNIKYFINFLAPRKKLKYWKVQIVNTESDTQESTPFFYQNFTIALTKERLSWSCDISEEGKDSNSMATLKEVLYILSHFFVNRVPYTCAIRLVSPKTSAIKPWLASRNNTPAGTDAMSLRHLQLNLLMMDYASYIVKCGHDNWNYQEHCYKGKSN